MTDKQALYKYRIGQAKETLRDAEMMIKNKISARSIVNRAYYSVFYAILALFLRKDIDIKTSKHSGVISIFDREFIGRGEIDKKYSKTVHKLLEARQVGDYKEFVKLSLEDAIEMVKLAKEFIKKIEKIRTAE